MNGDDTTPLPPPGDTTPLPPVAEPGRPSMGALPLLEMALFAAVFIAGGVLAWLAAFGETSAGTTSQPPLPAPVTIPSLPDIDLPDFEELPDAGPAFDEQVQFSGARGDTQPPVGCSAHIDWVWEIDRGLSPPISGRALIEVTGGDAAGEYRRPITGGEIRLSLDVQLSSHDVFTADVISVGGTPAFPTPLEVSYDTPFC